MEETFYSPKEVAEKLKIHRATVVKYILQRKLSASVVGGKLYRISETQLQEFLDDNTIKRG